MSGTTLPLIMTSAGPQPTPATTIQQTIISTVAAQSPGYTAELPASLIEDVVDTQVAGLQQADQARVDAVNDVSPLAANPFILAMFGQQMGIPQGIGSNTSVAVVFTVTSSGSPVSGLVLPAGVVVSDGTYTYVTQTAVTTQMDGTTQQVAAIATQSGSWAVGAGTVTNVNTSFPSTYVVAVTNPNPGTAALAAQTVPQYRAQILAAQQVTVQGTPGYISTVLANIPGVQSRLILVDAITGGLKIICGLTVDQNLIAGGIYQSVPDVSLLQGSQLAITSISAATNAVITTNENSNLSAGAVLTVTGATPSAYNTTYTVVSVNGTAVTTSTDSSAFGAYGSGATFSPNPRNVTTTITDGPNTFSIVFVNPPNQVVTGSVTWATNLASFSSGTQVNQLAATALAIYINSIQVGQPINELEMTAAIQAAVATLLPPQNLIAVSYSININGVTTAPQAGTSIIPGDAESYFSAAANAFTVTQG